MMKAINMGDHIMNKTLCSAFGVSLIIVALAGNASADSLLTGSQIQQLLSGNTVTGTAGLNKQFLKTYHPDGTFKLEVDGQKWAGIWRVVGDKYCQSQDQQEQCYTVQKIGTSYQMLDEKGNNHTTFTFK